MSLIPCLPPFHIHSISYRGWTSLLNFRFREWFEFAPWLSNSLHVEFSYILDIYVSLRMPLASSTKQKLVPANLLLCHELSSHPEGKSNDKSQFHQYMFLLLFINMYFWIQGGFQVSLQFCTSEYTWFISS